MADGLQGTEWPWLRASPVGSSTGPFLVPQLPIQDALDFTWQECYGRWFTEEYPDTWKVIKQMVPLLKLIFPFHLMDDLDPALGDQESLYSGTSGVQGHAVVTSVQHVETSWTLSLHKQEPCTQVYDHATGWDQKECPARCP
ncbi:Leucine-Rich Repeat Protein 1 [Manis pentadactyla]|nr:Leucine-Rich Repeat Protein 1 [Manis pentadactyla]